MGSFLPSFFSKKLAAGGTHLPRVSPTNQNLNSPRRRNMIDNEYIKQLQHELHRFPELGFDLPKTLAIVKRELDKIGIEYTEKYGKSSIVAEINPEKTNFTIAIRADMDALAILEQTGLEYASEIEGQMHACGHDAHTSILIATVKALYEMKEDIACRVRFIFQPSEECPVSGAKMMVDNGVMDGVDVIIGLHVGGCDSGEIGFCVGPHMAASRPFKLEFFGKSTHAATPHNGKDALAAAVRAYTSIKLMTSTEITPLEKYICSIGKLNAGTAQNIIPDYAEMVGTIRSFNLDIDKYIIDRIKGIAEGIKAETGIDYKLTTHLKSGVVYNDPKISELLMASAEKVVGKEKTVAVSMRLGAEDFAFYGEKAPATFFRLGISNVEKGYTVAAHNSKFIVDDDVLHLGAETFVQFVLDNMNGFENN
jgi:amidohydrolase